MNKEQKEKSMNKLVAKFSYKKRKYEIDKLLDSSDNNFGEYDIFDVTNSKTGEAVGHISANPSEARDFLIKEAKWEIDNEIL